jgi:hypothetical protein
MRLPFSFAMSRLTATKSRYPYDHTLLLFLLVQRALAFNRIGLVVGAGRLLCLLGQGTLTLLLNQNPEKCGDGLPSRSSGARLH